MDPTIPAGAARLLDFIGSKEAPKGYGTVYGNNQHKLAKPLTSMTIGQIIGAKPTFTKRFGSSACGRYQFMRATLQDLVKEGAAAASDILSPDLQDRLGYQLLRRRGYAAFMAGRITRTEFGKRLAQEWASFPVLAAAQGAHRKVKRGETYYSGDKLNKALVSAAEVERVLDEVLRLGGAPAPKPALTPVPLPVARPEGLVAPPLAEVEGEDPGFEEDDIEVSFYPSPAMARKVQQLLKDRGYHEVGVVGSGWGSRSKDTLAAWKASWNRRNPRDPVAPCDIVTDDVIAKLEADDHRPIAETRANATVSDLPPEKQAVVKQGGLWTRVLTWLGIGGFAGEQTGLLDRAEEVSGGWLRVRSVMESIGITLADNWPFVLIAAGVGLWFFIQHIKNRDLALVREGKLMS